MSFRKEVTVSTQAPVGKRDLKKLRKDVEAQLPALSPKDLDALVPLSGEWNALKLKGSGTVVYQQVGRPPTLFDLDGRGDLWPTVNALWAFPDMLPTLETHGPVTRHLLKGADLMLPGVIVPDGGLPPIAGGAKVAVRAAGNASPVAVGTLAISTADAAEGAMKGKGVAVVHVYRDMLWSFGGRAVPNPGFGAEEVAACEGAPPPDASITGITTALASATVGGAAEDAEAHPSQDDGAGDDGPAAAPADASDAAPSGAYLEAAAVAKLSALSMDDLLVETLKNAVASTLTDDKLPLDASDVYQKHMQPAKPASVPMDAKRSTFKQVAKFFKAQQKAKLIGTKEHKGEIKVVSIDRSHPFFAQHAPSWPVAGGGGAASGKADEAAANNSELEAEIAAVTRSAPPKVSELVGPTHYLEKLFAELGLAKSTLVTKEEAFERVLFAYIDKAGLSSHHGQAEDDEEEEEETVKLDAMLIDSLFKVAGGQKKGTEFPESASLGDCESRFEQRLQAWHRVEVDGHEPRERKGPLPRIQVGAGRAAGHNKTTVSGLETYRVDPEALARYGRRLFNCTTSVAELPGKNVHDKEVTLQGHCLREVTEHLIRVYKIPKTCIELADKKR
mmetsp:Transcript_12080/g.32438  ORF Transcript_12080/g.32438 Transcript_12080/m.32438 type:complete len:617 (-) Transcript_12080:227-2077(-)